MTEFPAVFTNDLQMLKKLREDNAGKPLYFACDFDSLKNLLEKKKINSILLKKDDFSHELQNKFPKSKYNFYFIEDETKLEKIQDLNFSNHEKLYRDLSPKHESKSFNQILGISSEIKKLKYKILKTAETNFPILITGETGTGKTLVANAIHELSSRGKKSILELNVNEISEGLFESTLFGHEKGAFTGADSAHKGFFEEADSTSFFLDEIGDLPLHLQAKLLRVIDKKEFFPVGSNRAKKTDARLIFATNANLPKKIINGEFRRDLYRRLKNLLIEVPPLRKRREDIPILAESYMEKNGNGKRLSKTALQFLQSCDWPENIGQLENCLNRAIVFSEGSEINPEDLEF